MMAFELAFRAPPGLFAAFVTNCGAPHVGYGCVPSLARPHLHIHATNDKARAGRGHRTRAPSVPVFLRALACLRADYTCLV